jgi:coenzyme Q-binding protein COQ10
MPTFTVSRRVRYSARQLYDIVSDVASYKEFLPLVRASAVRNREERPDGSTTFEAQMTVVARRFNIRETFRSVVTVDPKNLTVKARSPEDAPNRIQSDWRIVADGEKSAEVTLTIDYQLQSRSRQFLLSSMFDLIVRKAMNAFEDRARSLYG